MTTAGSAAAAQPRTARPRVLVQRLDSALPLPAYAIVGDAGADIVTAVDVDLAPGHRAVLPTGIAIALPDGHAAFVHPRSGLAARAGLALVNSPGTIDSGYRGEIKVIVINLDPALPLHLARGERIAQLVIQRVEHAEFVEVDALPTSDRGVDGHGSTGGAAALATPSSELDRDPAGPGGGADGAGSGVVAAGAASSDAAVEPEPVGGADGARSSEMATGGALTAPEEGRR